MAAMLNAIEKTILILKTISEHNPGYSKKELVELLELNRSTVHRIVKMLEMEMLVIKNPVTDKYQVGPELFHLGSTYLKIQGDMAKIVYILNRASNGFPQGLGFAKLEGAKIISLYEVESNSEGTIGYHSGMYYPYHCGATGKCIMAFLEPRERVKELVLKSGLKKYTDNTITSIDKLMDEFNRIREQGYATSCGERIADLFGVSAPVFDSNKQLVGAVSTAFYISLLTDSTFENIKNRIVETANLLSIFF